MTLTAGKIDSRGHPTTKQCPACPAVLGRTRTKCGNCGHVFIRHPRKRAVPTTKSDATIEIPRFVQTPAAKAGRPPRVDPDAPAPDSDVDKLFAQVATKPTIVPHDDRFYCQLTPSGGVLICWPGFDVRFTLSQQEASILRKALS